MSDDGERTHDPTPHRREQFRKEGKFARARDGGAIAATIGAVLALVGGGDATRQAMWALFESSHGDLGALSRGDGVTPVVRAAGVLGAIAAPAALAAAIGGVAAGAAQAGVRFDAEMIGFKAERLDPIPRLKDLFVPKRALIETGLAVLRVGAVAYVAYAVLASELPELMALTGASPSGALERLLGCVLRLSLKIVAALAAMSAVDYAQNRWTLEKQMKMTLQELKEESRSNDGDPKVKGRMRARARALAKRRRNGDVKTADVVVTNPTHVSVALRYRDGDPAPVVLAKGHDHIALQIRMEARKHGVPIVENRALARALDADIPVGRPITGAYFSAVAQVLAYVYRLRGRATKARRRA